MVQAIMTEADMKKDKMQVPVESVYFGGGTPSLLDAGELSKILERIFRNHEVRTDAEITLEANPDDIHAEALSSWRAMGINRISLGIQSFHDRELKWMNRSHDADAARKALHEISAAGFDNISADLIFGSPLSDVKMLTENLDLMTQAGIPHLSCYALTVEPGTPLHKRIKNNSSLPVHDEMQAGQFRMLMERLEREGFEQYEISNFARPGYRSRHNSSYWKGSPYLGLGPSAHGFDGARTRYANVQNNNIYLSLIAKGLDPAVKEELSDRDLINETVMIRLRMHEGLDLKEVSEKFGEEEAVRIEKESAAFVTEGWASVSDRIITLTTSGKLMADGIASRLFLV